MEGLYHQQRKTVLQMVVQLKETRSRTEIHTLSHALMQTLSNKMNNDWADGHCYVALPGFYDLGRLATPILPLMDHFLYRFSTFS